MYDGSRKRVNIREMTFSDQFAQPVLPFASPQALPYDSPKNMNTNRKNTLIQINHQKEKEKIHNESIIIVNSVVFIETTPVSWVSSPHPPSPPLPAPIPPSNSPTQA